MRLARARPSNPLRHLRDPDLVDARSGDTPDVCRTDWVRSAQLPPQEVDQGGEAETYVGWTCALLPSTFDEDARKLHPH